MSHMLAKQQLHVLGVEDGECHPERRGQSEKDETGEPPVRRVHAHLPLDLEPLADDVGEVVEDFRQVATGIALDQYGGDEKPYVEQPQALG